MRLWGGLSQSDVGQSVCSEKKISFISNKICATQKSRSQQLLSASIFEGCGKMRRRLFKLNISDMEWLVAGWRWKCQLPVWSCELGFKRRKEGDNWTASSKVVCIISPLPLPLAMRSKVSWNVENITRNSLLESSSQVEHIVVDYVIARPTNVGERTSLMNN